MKQDFLTISLACHTIYHALLVFIDGHVFLMVFTFYIQCMHFGMYEYMKTKGLNLREVTSLPKCHQWTRIKMIAQTKLHAELRLHFANDPILFGLVCDFEWLMLSHNVGQK